MLEQHPCPVFGTHTPTPPPSAGLCGGDSTEAITWSCALVRVRGEVMEWWPPAPGDTSKLGLHLSYGQIGKRFHFFVPRSSLSLVACRGGGQRQGW